MTSMAAQLAASLPALNVPAPDEQAAKKEESVKVPARMEEALDVEGKTELKEVELNGLVRRWLSERYEAAAERPRRTQAIMKILKHSTDPAQPQPTSSSSANYQGRDRENHHANDAVGLLLGIDLSGTMEVSDCFPIPPVDGSGRGDKFDSA